MYPYMAGKLEDLLNENKEIYEKLAKYKEESEEFKLKIHQLHRDKSSLSDQICSLEKEVMSLKREAKAKDKTMHEREKVLKNEINRKDLFKNRLLGCKKDEQMTILKDQLNTLSRKNTILMRMLYEVTRLVGSDFEIFNSLLEITDTHDCEVLEEYLKSLRMMKDQ